MEQVYVETIMPHKLSLDMAYIARRSLSLDLRLMAQTVTCLFRADEPDISLPAASGTGVTALQ
jgi:lipopolysaccharide/colanic/teichoic acid biosynthesis glycosyltransferase